MSSAEFKSNFEAFVSNSVARTKGLADRAMILFTSLRVSLIVLSAMLPALTILAPPIWPAVAAIAVTILTGIDTQFRWGEEWRHSRSTQITLERLQRECEDRAAELGAGATAGDITTQNASFDRFRHDVEVLMQTETDRFFQFRVTEWKSKE